MVTPESEYLNGAEPPDADIVTDRDTPTVLVTTDGYINLIDELIVAYTAVEVSTLPKPSVSRSDTTTR